MLHGHPPHSRFLRRTQPLRAIVGSLVHVLQPPEGDRSDVAGLRVDLYPGASRQAALDLDLYLEAASVGHTWGGGESTDEPSEESPGNRGGAYRDRTGDLRLAKPALSQLS